MELAIKVAGIVAPVFALAGIGLAWVRMGLDYDVRLVTRLSMTLSVPCLIFMALVRTGIEPAALRDIALASLAAYAITAAVAFAAIRALRLDVATYLAPIIFGNTGNIGLPVALFAFGQAGLDVAVVVFAVMVLLSFTVGVWLVAGGGPVSSAWREPLVWATAAGILFLLAGWPVPDWVANTLDLVGQMAIPLMLITLGVAISQLRPAAFLPALALSAGKLLVCAGAALAAGALFGLQGMVLGVLTLQLCTPLAVTSYMLAEKYGAEAQAVAGLVVVSTLVSIPAIPLILAAFVHATP